MKKNLIIILFTLLLTSIYPLAKDMDNSAVNETRTSKISSISSSKTRYDFNFFNAIKESPPSEYKKISERTDGILSNFPEDYIVLEILTDNMASYMALFLTNSENHLSKAKYSEDRIHTIGLSNRDFSVLKFLESGLVKFSTQKIVNIYNILNLSAPSPTRYLLLKTQKCTMAIAGVELLSDDALSKLKNRNEFEGVYFWHLFISYLKATGEYGTLKSFGL